MILKGLAITKSKTILVVVSMVDGAETSERPTNNRACFPDSQPDTT